MARATTGNTLKIKVEGADERIALSSLLRVLRETLDILRTVDEQISEEKRHTLKWEITNVSLNSPFTMTIVGRPVTENYSEGVATAYLDGMASLESGATTPRHFNDDAITRAKSLVAARNNGVASVVYSSPGHKPVEPTQRVAANADAIFKIEYRYEHGSLSGMLKAIDIHGRFVFAIYDILTGRRTRCHFTEELFEEAQASLRHRVIVSGRIRYNRQGHAISMRADKLYRMRPAERLPQFRAGEEIDITGGMDSVEFIRRMRDAE